MGCCRHIFAPPAVTLLGSGASAMESLISNQKESSPGSALWGSLVNEAPANGAEQLEHMLDAGLIRSTSPVVSSLALSSDNVPTILWDGYRNHISAPATLAAAFASLQDSELSRGLEAHHELLHIQAQRALLMQDQADLAAEWEHFTAFKGEVQKRIHTIKPKAAIEVKLEVDRQQRNLEDRTRGLEDREKMLQEMELELITQYKEE
mmetsp:Transcript_49871/g.92897  ORF Transcript_49871/g.92897 Transcript_49871/m.92897 type:complete len:207 (+) Transcript_49871:103-723(+)